MIVVNRTVLIVVPGKPFLEWLHRVDVSNLELSLDDLHSEPTAYLLDEYTDEEGLESGLKAACKQIFDEELEGWWTERPDWPKGRNLKLFKEWFEYSVHSIVIDLGTEPLRGSQDEE